MLDWLAGLVALIVFGYLFLHIKIYIAVQYVRKAEDDALSIDVHMLNKLISYHLELPIADLTLRGFPWLKTEFRLDGDLREKSGERREPEKNKFKSNLHELGEWRHIIREILFFSKLYKHFAREIEGGLSCEKFYWKTRYGSEDSALTGLLIGLMWAAKSWYMALLGEKLVFNCRPVVKVLPAYTSPAFETEFECIFSIVSGNVINATLSLIKFGWKGVKDSGRTPNPGINENGDGKHQRHG